MNTFFYIYVLRSLKDGDFYTGYTHDLRKRIDEHKKGAVFSTKHRLPVELIYYEACLSQQDATHREKYLKTAWGKRYLKVRLKHYLTG
jgi:putative endonuclease